MASTVTVPPSVHQEIGEWVGCGGVSGLSCGFDLTKATRDSTCLPDREAHRPAIAHHQDYVDTQIRVEHPKEGAKCSEPSGSCEKETHLNDEEPEPENKPKDTEEAEEIGVFDFDGNVKSSESPNLQNDKTKGELHSSAESQKDAKKKTRVRI